MNVTMREIHFVFTTSLWHLNSGQCCQLLFTALVRLGPFLHSVPSHLCRPHPAPHRPVLAQSFSLWPVIVSESQSLCRPPLCLPLARPGPVPRPVNSYNAPLVFIKGKLNRFILLLIRADHTQHGQPSELTGFNRDRRAVSV